MNKDMNLDFFDCLVFDMDGTLAISKGPISPGIAQCLNELLKIKKVAVISGGMFSQFEKQLISHISNENLKNLFILPTSGAAMFSYTKDSWIEVYSNTIPSIKRKQIIDEIWSALKLTNYYPTETFGEVVEDRISQITFSALGSLAPVEKKSTWDPNQEKRKVIVSILKESIPEYTITIGGTNSIDITLQGVDKAYGVQELSKASSIPLSKILFIGDKLQPGGNDYPVKRLGIETLEVKDQHETESLLKSWLS